MEKNHFGPWDAQICDVAPALVGIWFCARNDASHATRASSTNDHIHTHSDSVPGAAQEPTAIPVLCEVQTEDLSGTGCHIKARTSVEGNDK